MSPRVSVLILAALFPGAAASQGQPDFEKVELKREKLADNLYVLFGYGGNVALLTGEDGAVLVDDQFAPLVPKIRAAVEGVTDEPVRFVVNTHFHFDHTDANQAFGEAGAVIVAHENTRKRLSTKQVIDYFNIEVPAQPAAALPVVTFTQSVSFHLNGEDVDAVHAANAHTDSDAILYFRKANVVHMGDVFQGPYYPFIDMGSGGSIDGILAALKEVLSRTDAKTRFIPGHAPVAARADLEAFAAMMGTVRKRIADAIAAGKTQEEVVASAPTKDFDARYAKGMIPAAAFVQRVYADLKRPGPPKT
jgi:cyclase